ncbi:3-hydroxyacyl-CoA dehydratase 2 [Myotis brandtii]|uniref:Very-long-chain (3R)-3-hydroxyacyl-CoA dehydratase n=1 Tax=Myotis brandtii TaxID=109478 RepID=S7N7B3_MYOBR|nr:3-hydroxyacyl-CoA dehydratase 2 [Myotis brandtii]
MALSNWAQRWAPAAGVSGIVAGSGCKRRLPTQIVPQEQGEVEKSSGAIRAGSHRLHPLTAPSDQGRRRQWVQAAALVPAVGASAGWDRSAQEQRIFSNHQRLAPMTATSAPPWSGAPAHLLHHPATILHCAIGIVPSSVVLTSFQVMSRVFLIWAVTHSVKEVQSEDSVLLFVIAWTITEIIRYSFYTFSLLNHLPYLIKWARYTLFIVLYPMGVSGELLTIYAALPFVRQAGLYSISLPNKYNFSFDYYAFLILIMISYIPLFPQLYFHMIHQRRKVLSHTEEHKKFE